MGFRSHTTFNRFDTSIGDGKRITIENGVAKRCATIFAFMVKEYKALQKMSIEDTGQPFKRPIIGKVSIIAHMKSLDSTINDADVTYAIKKMVADELIAKDDWREGRQVFYYLRHNPKHIQIKLKAA
jgi:hypothetical protein